MLHGMNAYFDDAKCFLSKCSALLSDPISGEDSLDATLFFAIGVERLLKSILAGLNPAFVYMDQSFKNLAPLLYKKHLASSAQSNKEFSQRPDSRVISLRLALLRSKEFSQATNKHYNTLLDLSHLRDVIVHQPLSEYDVEKAKALLASFLSVMTDYAQERGISLPELIGDRIHGLEFLASKYEGDIADKVEKKLQYYRAQWEKARDDPLQSARLEQLRQTSGDPDSYNHAECPACGNVARFSAEIEWDYSDGQTHAVGVFPTALRCPFCGYYTKDGAEMDHLGLQDIFYEHQQDR